MSEIEFKIDQEKNGNFRHELYVEGKVVSRIGVYNLVMRIGVASVRMGGIAGVGTPEEHRGKGYSRRVLENSNVWMTQEGFDCATLFGIAHYYNKFGYLPCLPECRVEVPTRYALLAPQSLSARPFTPEDVPAVRAIYDANNAAQTGSIVRNAHHKWLHLGTTYGRGTRAVVFTDAQGEVVAYTAYDTTNESNPIDYEMMVAEVGARERKHFPDIVRWLAERAAEMHEGTLQFHLPPDSPFVAHLALYGAEQKIVFERMADGMGRLLRIVPFFEKTLPEWTRRAREARNLPAGRSLRLETDLGSVALQWTGEAVERIEADSAAETLRLPQSHLMQVVMGYFGIEDALIFPEVSAQGELMLATALFPRRLPYMWKPDRF
jgi:regulator of extracellular matrix RemA (YlzA/DUF370 family)